MRDAPTGTVVSPVVNPGTSQRPTQPTEVPPKNIPKKPPIAAPSTKTLQSAAAPAYALQALAYVRKNGRAPAGYEGGRSFTNYQRVVPYADGQGRRISYQERDVHPHVMGVNRGAERLVTSKDDAYFTADHYKTFIRISE
jgi:ribonuclease T1